MSRDSSESLLDVNKPPSVDFETDEWKFEDDSPYEEVRAAVSNTDDSEIACVYPHKTGPD